MAVKISRPFNLELEKEYKEKEEKLLDEAKKYRIKQFALLRQRYGSPMKKNRNEKNSYGKYKASSNNVKAVPSTTKNIRFKVISSLPSPEARCSRLINLKKTRDLHFNNIVVDSDSGICDNGVKDEKTNLQETNIHNKIGGMNSIKETDIGYREEHIIKNYSDIETCPSQADQFNSNYSCVAKLDITQNDELKLHNKIRVLEQQEKILNNRLILPLCSNLNNKMASTNKKNTNQFIDSAVNTISSISAENKVDNTHVDDNILLRRVLDKKQSLLENLMDEFVNLTRKTIISDLASSECKVDKHSQTSLAVEEKNNSTVLTHSTDESKSKPSPFTSLPSDSSSENSIDINVEGKHPNSRNIGQEFETKCKSTEKVLLKRHTRHKSSCKNCSKYKKIPCVKVVSSSSSLISKHSGGDTSNDESQSHHYYKAVQVIVNVNSNSMCGTSVKEIPIKSREEGSLLNNRGNRRPQNNWRKIFDEGEDKLTESSYFSPPQTAMSKQNVQKPTAGVKNLHKRDQFLPNAELKQYIEKLLSMRRDSIDQLNVSSCSTPSEISFVPEEENFYPSKFVKKIVIPDYTTYAFNELKNLNKSIKYPNRFDTKSLSQTNDFNCLFRREIQTPRSNQISNAISTSLSLEEKNNLSPTTENILEMNKQLLNLNLNMADFETKLKAMCDIVDILPESIQQSEFSMVDIDTRADVVKMDQEDGVLRTSAISDKETLNMSQQLTGKYLMQICEPIEARNNNVMEKSVPVSNVLQDKQMRIDTDKLHDLPTMDDLMRIGLITRPFNYARSDIVPSDDDINKMLEITPLPKSTETVKSDVNIKRDIEPIKPPIPVLSPSNNTLELEQIIRQLGLSWMTTTLQKTKEAFALSSSSSTENSKSRNFFKNSNDVSAENFSNRKSNHQFAPVTEFFKSDEMYMSPIENAKINKK